MKFTFIEPDKPAAIFGNAWKIFADGVIEEGSHEEFRQRLAAQGVTANSIRFALFLVIA